MMSKSIKIVNNRFRITPIIISLLVGILGATVFITATYYIDNTTISAGNGLYKARVLTMHLAGRRAYSPGHSFYINHPLYADFVVGIWKLFNIPSWPGSILVKIAVVNSLTAGVTLGFLWFGLFYITRNKTITSLITMLYAGGGYFFFLTISNEDILPALSLFIPAVVMLIVFFHHNRWYTPVFLAGGLFGIAILLHRTFIVGYPAFIITLLVHTRIHRYSVQHTIQLLAAFCIASLIPTIVLTPNPSAILLTSYSASGWTGFSLNKVLFTLLAGVGQSIVFGKNLQNIPNILQPEHMLPQLTTLGVVGLLLWRLMHEIRTHGRFTLLGIFLLINFVVLEVTNFFVQGQDPQFQMQPLILIPFAIAITYSRSHIVQQAFIRNMLVFSLAVVLGTNLTLALSSRGKDTKHINALNTITKAINLDTVVFITFGFDEFFTWAQFTWDITEPNTTFITFTYFPVEFPQFTIQETRDSFMNELQQAQQTGKQLFASDVLLFPDNEFQQIFSTINAQEKGLAMKHAFFDQYTIKPFLDTDVYGILYQVIPKQSP